MGNMDSELVIFCNQASLSVVGLGCIQPSYRLRGSHGDFQITQTDAIVESHSKNLTMESPLLKRTSIYLTEHRMVELVLV